MINIRFYIVCLFIILLTGCEATVAKPEVLTPENDTIESVTTIKYNTDEMFEGERTIIVNTLTVPYNNKFYTFVVNGPVNYVNTDTHFYVGDIYVELTGNEEECGLYQEENLVETIQQLDENTYIHLAGNDLDSIKNLLSNVYISDGTSYQMFDHKIADEWTKEVVITEDVISFSNGEDTIYIYHNEGSPDGPTIFYKQLDNIDIPITYPEEGFGFNYIPYGFTEYEHLKVGEGDQKYTPYSAYDFGKVECVLQEKTPLSQMDTYKKEATEYGSAYIILAKDDETLYSLFEDKEKTSEAHSLQITFDSKKFEDNVIIKADTYDMSSIKELADEVVNSNNRYHTQLLLEDGKDVTLTFNSTKTGETTKYIDGLYSYLTRTEVEVSDSSYYVDGQEGYIAPPQNWYIKDQLEKNYTNPGIPGTVQETIYGGMDGMLIIPTLKIIRPTYKNTTSTMTDKTGDVPRNYGMSLRQSGVTAYSTNGDKYGYMSLTIDGHGSHTDDSDILKYKGFMWYTNFGLREYISLNDYVYYRDANKLYIYKCTGNDVVRGASVTEQPYANDFAEKDLFYDLYTRSCYVDDVENAINPGIMNAYELVSVIKVSDN